MKKFLITFALLLYSTSALSYNEQNHLLITKFAIEYLNKIFGEDFISNEEGEQILQGNRSEDSFGHKWVIRYWNQHFYNPLKPKKYWRRSKSIDLRFERIAKRCFKRADSDKFFYYVGEIVHHIQDATNPAHVVPVYHGGSLKDKFDEQEVEAFFPSELNINFDNSYSEPYLTEVLKPVAVKTLKSIKESFSISVKVGRSTTAKMIDWSFFWEENPESWFGNYGSLGAPDKESGQKIDNYLSCKIEKGDTTYLVDKANYERFSSRQIELAITKTAQFIYFAKTRQEKAERSN